MLLPRARPRDGSHAAPSTSRPRRLLVALVLLAAACWYPKERGARLEERIDRIEGEGPSGQADAGAAAAAQQQQAQQLDAALAQVRTRLDALEAARKAGPQPSARDAELGDELKRLRASLDEQGQRLAALEKTFATRAPAGGERVAEPRRAAPRQAGVRAPPAPAPGKAAESAVSAQGTGSTTAARQDALTVARQQELSGDKTVARELYEQYATSFPTDPTTAEARFRLGEMDYAERRYRDAIGQFGKIARDFPRSERAPDALLRTADSMLQLGMKDDAALLLSDIPRRYPGTPAAAGARKRLADLPKTSAAASKPGE